MLPASAYSSALPLSRKAAQELFARPEDLTALVAPFLTFVQIPLEERIGEWRFAGAAKTLAEAVRRIERFAVAFQISDTARAKFIAGLLRSCSEGKEMYPKTSPREVSGPHRVVLCVQYGAPYEGLGAAIVEVESLDGSGFDKQKPESELPKQWRKMSVQWVLKMGTKQFGPPSDEVKAAIKAEKRSAVWGTWRRRWKRFKSWADLMPSE